MDPFVSGPGAASVKDVAARAEVSVGTVSNVLNRPAQVAEATRRRVRAAMAELGFVRNESARQLRAGASRTIAVVVLDVANPFFADVVTGVEQVADEHDALVMVCSSGGDAERERRHLERLAEMRVMGVLITPVDSDHVSRLSERGIPVVLVDRVPDGLVDPGTSPLRSVAVDDVLGGRLAGSHLAGLGHRRVAFIGGPADLPQVRDRLAGLRAGLSEGGVDVAGVVEITTPELSAPAGALAVLRLLAQQGPDRPSAVFCANDLLALGVLSECLRAGVRVPEDLAIVGYDDIPYAGFAAVPLTSVRQPSGDLGRTAARMLVDGMSGPGPGWVEGATSRARPGVGPGRAEAVMFEPTLVVRTSTVARHA